MFIFVATAVVDSLYHSNVLTLFEIPIVPIFGIYIVISHSTILESIFSNNMKQQKVLNEKLSELNNVRNEFLHTTANEMQTPVSKLNNMVEKKLRHEPTGQNATKTLDIISAISKKNVL